MIKVFTSLSQLEVQLLGGKLRSLLLMSVLSLCVVMLSSCDDDAEPDSSALDADRLTLVTVSEATAGDVLSIQVAGLEEGTAVSWSIAEGSDIASITGSGSIGELLVTGEGTVLVEASSGGVTGFASISVSLGELSASIASDGNGVVANGDSETLTITYNYPLATAPSVSAASAGAFGALTTVSDTEYTVTFTGDATDAASVDLVLNDAVAAATHGGVSATSTFEGAMVVDNIAPYGASASTDLGVVNDGSTVVASFTFTEGIQGGTVDISGGGITAVVAQELVATEDPAVWTASVTTDGVGNGTVVFDVLEASITDLAGISMVGTASVPAASFEVDNIEPDIAAATNTAVELVAGENIMRVSTDADGGMFVILTDGSDAPTTVEEFEDAWSGSADVVLAAGTYDVYFAAVDAAGNADVDGAGALVVETVADVVIQ